MNERDRKKFSTKKMQQMLVWWVNELPDGLDLNLSVPPPPTISKGARNASSVGDLSCAEGLRID